MTISQNTEQLIQEQQRQLIADEIKLAKANAESDIKLADAVKRLFNNEDFKLVVSETYFSKELTKAASAISMNGNEDLNKRDIIRLKGIHCFREFLSNILKNGNAGLDFLSKSTEELIALYEEQFDLGE